MRVAVETDPGTVSPFARRASRVTGNTSVRIPFSAGIPRAPASRCHPCLRELYEGTRTTSGPVRRRRDPGGGARRVGAPYPVFLALGGALLAFLPGAPSFTLPPELALALFVAPVLLDAAYDASLRDLRDNWAPVTGLVVFAVGLTTAAVAVVARTLVPAMPWAPAIALGAVVAPPDAVAATAVLRPLRPPHRILTILEGESLLNDASALLIYRLAVGAVAANGFSIGDVAPTFLLAVAGSVVVGPALGWLTLAGDWIGCSTCRPRSFFSSSPRSACGSSPNTSGCQAC